MPFSKCPFLPGAPRLQELPMSEKTRRRDLHAGALSSCPSGIVPVDRDDATVLSPATRVVRCAVSLIVRGHACRDFEIPRMCVRYKGLYRRPWHLKQGPYQTHVSAPKMCLNPL
jgi:hypothetical protein